MTQNALFIDFEYCTGCHSCEIACRNELELPSDGFGIKVLEDKPRQNPDGQWHWDYIAVPTELCDMCVERTAEGKLPACVQSCRLRFSSTALSKSVPLTWPRRVRRPQSFLA